MQTVIDIQEEDLIRLDRLSKVSEVSRDEIVRAAIASYLARVKALDESFGIWATKNEDGLQYQQRLREEW